MVTRSVDSLLDDMRLLGGDQRLIAQAVRMLVRKTLSGVTEEVKYGGILLSSSGVQIGGIFAYKEHVSVEFSKGVAIDDVFGWLEGAGKGRRHLKLRSLADIKVRKLADYLPKALAAARSAT
jgi:hypothetical protein